MPIDLTSARQSAEAYLLNDSCVFVRPRVLDDGAGNIYPDPDGPQRIGPFPCAFRALSGREIVSADQLKEQGAYRVKVATALIDPDTDEPFTPAVTDEVEVLGGVYRIVWAPPVAALNLFRVLGLENV